MPVDLASPLTLPSGVSLPNRIAKSALSEGLGDRANAPMKNLVRLHRRWAYSGADQSVPFPTHHPAHDERSGDPVNRAIFLSTSSIREWSAARGNADSAPDLLVDRKAENNDHLLHSDR
ncbi:hypothetical protein NN3_13140 [Nocardia neocaledoniensis NBRC 108232]|nr:hypothetical protein NN3_13140 [Nocardia neocaledoniensis NBRC 108232]